MKRILLIITLFPFGLINAQINTGMVAHFPFNGSYNDITSAAIVGTNVGCVFGLDRNSNPNQAIELSGNDYVTINNNANVIIEAEREIYILDDFETTLGTVVELK